MNFINSYYITNIILISKTLSKIFPKIKKNKTLILHDAVNINNFKYRKNNNKIRNLTYIGSFYKGKGIELIYKLAEKFKKLISIFMVILWEKLMIYQLMLKFMAI